MRNKTFNEPMGSFHAKPQGCGRGPVGHGKLSKKDGEERKRVRKMKWSSRTLLDSQDFLFDICLF